MSLLNIRQSGHGRSFPWLCWLSVIFGTTVTLPHLIQLQHEYKKLLENFNCDIQEFITVQDPPAPPSKILHLPPLTSLHSATTRNMELPQPGEPRKSYLSRENRVRFNHHLNELYLVNS